MTINGFEIRISINPITVGENSIRYVVIGRNGDVTKGEADSVRGAMRDIIGMIIRACAKKTENEERRAS